jgi:hypothetical protein
MNKRFVSLFFALAISASGVDYALQPSFVRAIHTVESGGRSGNIIGDNGKALGPLQIHKACWVDALAHNPSIRGKYSDCTNLQYSIMIMTSYLNKYEQKAVLNRQSIPLARCWNGGPHWRDNPKKTDGYCRKVISRLNH